MQGEELDPSADGLIQSSRGWFDAEDYAAQVAHRQAGPPGAVANMRIFVSGGLAAKGLAG